MYFRQGEWSTRGAESVGSSGGGAGALEAGKVVILAFLCLACGASWFVDPFAPTNSGPAGYLGLPFDTGGLPVRDRFCKPLERAAQLCRKEHPAPPPKSDAEKGWVERLAEKGGHKQAAGSSSNSGWQAILSRAGALASDSGEADGCASAKVRAGACGQAARVARETVQLRCSSEVRLDARKRA
jgi:hypothetical protein